MATRKIFNAATQQVEDATLSVDQNNEIVAEFADGSFLKFPAGLTQEQFDEQIDAHEEANTGQIVITPEYEAAQAAERAASLALIGEVPETTSPDTTETTADAVDTTDETDTSDKVKVEVK